MKYFIVLLVVCVAVAAAAPQLLTYPGITGLTGYPGLTTGVLGVSPLVNPLATRTLVTGPTVVNGWGGRLIAPGYVGTTIV